MSSIKKDKALLKKLNQEWPVKLKKLSHKEWPHSAPSNLIEVWRSRTHLVQVCNDNNMTRLSVCRSTIKADGRWVDGITWDELQRLKSECGRGSRCAIELYPPDNQVVDVANIRHLWLLDKPPEFMWKEE